MQARARCPLRPQLKHFLFPLRPLFAGSGPHLSSAGMSGFAFQEVLVGLGVELVTASPCGAGGLLANGTDVLVAANSFVFASSKCAFSISSSMLPSIPTIFACSSGHRPDTNWLTRTIWPTFSASAFTHVAAAYALVWSFLSSWAKSSTLSFCPCRHE